MYGYTRTEDRIAQNRWRKEKYGKNKTKTSPTPAATQQGETAGTNAKSGSTAGVPQTVVVTGDDVFTHGNEYTTTSQRKKQQHSLNEIFKEKSSYTAADKKRDENINNYLYGNKDKPKSDNVFKDINSTDKNSARSIGEENSSFLQKVENQTIDLIGGKRKSTFDWLDGWNNFGDGPNKEISETTKDFKFENQLNPDLISGAQGKSPFKNPVLNYDNMINPPDKDYRHNDVYWNKKASKYNPAKSLVNFAFSIKPAELDKIVQKPVEYIPHIDNFADVKFSDKSAANTRNKVFSEYIGGYDGYGLNIDGGIPNAFMHIYLAAKMTDFLGEKIQEIF